MERARLTDSFPPFDRSNTSACPTRSSTLLPSSRRTTSRATSEADVAASLGETTMGGAVAATGDAAAGEGVVAGEDVANEGEMGP